MGRSTRPESTKDWVQRRVRQPSQGWLRQSASIGLLRESVEDEKGRAQPGEKSGEPVEEPLWRSREGVMVVQTVVVVTMLYVGYLYDEMVLDTGG